MKNKMIKSSYKNLRVSLLLRFNKLRYEERSEMNFVNTKMILQKIQF